MTERASPFEEKFAALKAAYVAQLPEKLAVIMTEWHALKTQHSAETITLLHRNIHNLIGSSGTFGCGALSTAARELEELLKPLVMHSNQNFTLNVELTTAITAKINHLHLLVDTLNKSDEQPIL